MSGKTDIAVHGTCRRCELRLLGVAVDTLGRTADWILYYLKGHRGWLVVVSKAFSKPVVLRPTCYFVYVNHSVCICYKCH